MPTRGATNFLFYDFVRAIPQNQVVIPHSVVGGYIYSSYMLPSTNHNWLLSLSHIASFLEPFGLVGVSEEFPLSCVKTSV